MKAITSFLVSLPLISLTVSVPAIGGFYVGRYVERQDQLMSALAEKSSEVGDVETEVETPKLSKREKVILSADLAKAKGVPEKVSGPDGEYILVSVIEGVDENRQMTGNLRLVAAKRQKLGAISKQYDQTAASSVQQRELLAGQINEMKQALGRDLRVMAQSYSYSLANTYMRVPHVVSLVSVSEANGEKTTKVIHKFTTSAAYLEFQQKNETYREMKLEASKAAATASEGEARKVVNHKKTMPLPKGVVPAKPLAAGAKAAVKKAPQTEQIKALRAELRSLYEFDPESRHLLQYEKTALYARPAQS